MRRPLAPCPHKQMRGERVARVCRRGDGRRAVQYLAIANRREIVHRFGRSAAILGGVGLVFCLLWGSGIPRRAQACAWLALAEVVGPVQRPAESLAHVLNRHAF